LQQRNHACRAERQAGRREAGRQAGREGASAKSQQAAQQGSNADRPPSLERPNAWGLPQTNSAFPAAHSPSILSSAALRIQL
jgi:hypothetical protein